MIEALQLPFMQRALIVGVAVGAVAGFFGSFVVQRGLSFMGAGLAHAAFGGVALGLLIGVDPIWTAVPFTVAIAAVIVWVQERANLGGDVSIGIFFAASMALGVVFLSYRENYAGDAFAYLFGSVLALENRDLAAAALLFAAMLISIPLWPFWAYATFDRDLAMADRVPVRRHDYLLACLIAFCVALSIKLVGIVLVGAFLVVPAAAARLASRTFAVMTAAASCIGALGAILGLAVSYWLDWPSGPAIVLTQTAIFLALLARKP